MQIGNLRAGNLLAILETFGRAGAGSGDPRTARSYGTLDNADYFLPQNLA